MLKFLLRKIKKLKNFIPYLPILLIIFVAGLLISIASPPPVTHVESWYGDPDLRGHDFENYVVHLRGFVEYAPNVLLSPVEFEAWINDSANEASFGWASRYTTATSRIRLYVEDGKWYTFTRYAAEFSRRIYVNGEWLLDIGRPGQTPETDIPNTGRITFTAQGVDGVIEIVQQSSNHVHRGGSAPLWWYVGTGTLLSDWARAEQYQTAIILGCFLMLALLFFVLFFTHGHNYANLLFSAFCLVWLVRMGVTGNRVFTVIFPQLSWFVKYRIEYIAIPLSAILTLAIVDNLFKGMLHKKVLYAIYGVSSCLGLLFTVLDTVVMSNLLNYMLYGYLVAAMWLSVCFVIFIWKRRKTRMEILNPEQKMLALGLSLFVVAVLTDTGSLTRFFHMPPFHMAGVAVLVFALFEAVAVFTTTMKQIEEVKVREFNAEAQKQRLEAENAALEKLSQEKTKFLASVSHELRTPLTVISNNAQLARMHTEGRMPTDNDFIVDTMRLITSDVERMAVMVKQLQDASRIEEGHMGYSFAPADITALIRDTMNTFCTELSKRNNNLILNLPNDTELLRCDHERIRQVLLNLATNANRFTKNGTITISLEKSQGFISIFFADTGEGIPAQIANTIFERYTTANPKKNENPSGTGLGLYISKHIIEAHGGTITAESEKGQGTVITFTLPVMKPTMKEGGSDG